MSASRSIGTLTSADTGTPFRQEVYVRETVFEIEGSRHALERETELNNREGDLGLDTHNDRVGTTQFRRVGDCTKRSRRKRIHDIECREIDDDGTAAKSPHLVR